MAIKDRHLRDYLGDGVYAKFDGYGVWLAVNDHNNEVIYLEPEIIEAIANFYKRQKENYGKTTG